MGPVVSMLEAESPAGELFRPPSADFKIIQIRSSGVFSYANLGAGPLKERNVAPGNLAIIPPNSPAGLTLKSAHLTRSFALDMDALGKIFDELIPHQHSPDFSALNSALANDEFIAAILDRIWSEAGIADLGSRLFMEGAVASLGVALVRAARHGVAPPHRGGLAPLPLKRVLELMEAEIAADLSLDVLARVAGVSPTHFCRAFKISTGMPPAKYLSDRKIEFARRLLADRRLSLVEIAFAVGFSGQAQFTTAFRRATGTTPGQWRRERLV
jgi:AraC family transcriptional regulator